MHADTGYLNFLISYMLTYSTAQFKLNIKMHVTLELLDKFVGPLMSFMQVHDSIS